MTQEEFLKFLWRCGFRSDRGYRDDSFLAFTFSDGTDYRKAEKAIKSLSDGSHLRDINILSLEERGFYVIVRKGNEGVQQNIEDAIGLPVLSVSGRELYICEAPIVVGNLQINPQTREAKWKGQTRILPDLRFQLVSFLAQQEINGIHSTDNYALLEVLGDTNDETGLGRLRRTVFNTNRLFRDRDQILGETLIASTGGGYGLSTKDKGGPITIGGLRIEPEAQRVYRDSVGFSLPPKQFSVVWLLAARALGGQTDGVPREQIRSACWEALDRTVNLVEITIRIINEKAMSTRGVDRPIIERNPACPSRFRLVS